jgi:hypothetical protein
MLVSTRCAQPYRHHTLTGLTDARAGSIGVEADRAKVQRAGEIQR